MRIHPIILAFVVILAPACGSKNDSTAKEKPGSKEGAAGEGICEEHGVLEAICTKCHPKLAAVFKAKGDWCEEHGFPMSVCPVHHPERHGRPVEAVDVAADAAPPDGTKVRLKTQDTARHAGLKTVKAERRPGGPRLEALASLTYDATKWARINARSPGVVRAIKVDIGSVVKAQSPLAVIESASVGADRSRLRAAGSRVAVAEAAYRRESDLQKQGLAATKEVLAAQQELDAAKAEQSAAAAAVGIVGPGAGASSYVLASPLAGVVTQRSVTIGHMVSAEEVLFEVVDTSTMRADIEIPETEISRIHVGQEVVVSLDALPDTSAVGTIDYVAPDIDRETRTVKARATLPNPDGQLRANMFGRARIALGTAEATVVVPRMAVQRVQDIDLVFVQTAAGEYEVRRVKTGTREGDRVEIVDGVKPDALVVVEGSFLLKTETLKGSIGAGCCE
jgi:cobalt-zinc-cadmium efflux system membrane fusion protein